MRDTNMRDTNTIDRIDRTRLRAGMPVYSADGQRLGPIEHIDADSLTVNGRRFAFSFIERLEGDRVYLTPQTGATDATTDRARSAAGTAGAGRDRVVEAEGAEGQ